MCTVRNDRYCGAGIGPKKLYAPVFYKDLSSVRHCAIAGWHIGVRAPFAYSLPLFCEEALKGLHYIC